MFRLSLGNKGNMFLQVRLEMGYNFFTNRNWKVRLLQVLNHIGLIYAIHLGLSIWWMASVAIYFLMFCIGVNVGVHRYFSHRSFKAKPYKEWFMGVSMVLATLGSPLAWAGMHRAHHRYSDTERDPHTPLVNKEFTWTSFFKTYFGIWHSYTAQARNTFDLRRSSLHKFLHFYYLLVIFSYVAVLFLIDPKLVLYCYCIPATFCFHAASSIVTFGHVLGKREFETGDRSRNNLILHWLTFGEGLHNHHHAFPSRDIYVGQPWYFFDVPGFVIRIFIKERSI